MELQAGKCSLCVVDNDKILTLKDSKKYFQILKTIKLNSGLLIPSQNSIEKSIKLCVICCHKLELIAKTNTKIHNARSKKSRLCCTCLSSKNLVRVPNDWTFLTSKIESFSNATRVICMECAFHFDCLHEIQANLLLKFPQLFKAGKAAQKPIASSKNAPRKRKLSSCWSYLQPLAKKRYNISESNKADDKIFKQIAYIDLTTATTESSAQPPKSKSSDVVRTPKKRFPIKIKLRNPKNRSKRVHSVPVEKKRALERRNSFSGEAPSAQLEETPRAHVADGAPKRRRVSDFIEANKDEEGADEVSIIVEKYLGDTTIVDEAIDTLVDDKKADSETPEIVETVEKEKETSEEATKEVQAETIETVLVEEASEENNTEEKDLDKPECQVISSDDDSEKAEIIEEEAEPKVAETASQDQEEADHEPKIVEKGDVASILEEISTTEAEKSDGDADKPAEESAEKSTLSDTELEMIFDEATKEVEKKSKKDTDLEEKEPEVVGDGNSSDVEAFEGFGLELPPDWVAEDTADTEEATKTNGNMKTDKELADVLVDDENKGNLDDSIGADPERKKKRVTFSV